MCVGYLAICWQAFGVRATFHRTQACRFADTLALALHGLLKQTMQMPCFGIDVMTD